MDDHSTAGPGPAVIRVEGLRVEQRGIILDGIDWVVRKGEHWALLGANGSGKTSLLKALTAYLSFSAGTVEVCGRVYGTTDWRRLREKVGLVSAGILDLVPLAETALETVASGARAQLGFWGRLGPDERARAFRILEQVECAPLADRPWGILSQGERQRVFIARALMARLALLLLDEPCAGLDPVARESFLCFLDRLAAKPDAPTLVLVTHHVEEIVPAISRVLVLKEGRAVAAGPKELVLVPGVLSDAFNATVSVERDGGRYRSAVTPKPGVWGGTPETP